MNQFIGMRVNRTDCINIKEVAAAAYGCHEFDEWVELRIDECGAAWAGAVENVRTGSGRNGYMFAAYTLGSGIRYAWVDASNWSILRSSASKSEILSNAP